MFYVYVLYSVKYQRFYIGFTQDKQARLSDHNRGKNKSTRPYLPWKLVYSEEYGSREEAGIREKYLKSSAGRRWRKKNIDLGD